MATERGEQMGLNPTELSSGILDELERFASVIELLDDAALAQRTLFWGLRVRDVVAHVAGVVTDVTSGNLDDLATPSAVARQLRQRDSKNHAAVLAELHHGRAAAADVLRGIPADSWAAPAPGGYGGTLRDAVQDLWEDFWLHGDDIRHALGMESDRGPGLRASVLHLARLLGRHRWSNAVLRLDGIEDIILAEPAAQERLITGDPVTFVRIVTGRASPGELGLEPSVVIAT
jgi:uncharacterized protein (TIGR03083 family)